MMRVNSGDGLGSIWPGYFRLGPIHRIDWCVRWQMVCDIVRQCRKAIHVSRMHESVNFAHSFMCLLLSPSYRSSLN